MKNILIEHKIYDVKEREMFFFVPFLHIKFSTMCVKMMLMISWYDGPKLFLSIFHSNLSVLNGKIVEKVEKKSKFHDQESISKIVCGCLCGLNEMDFVRFDSIKVVKYSK